MRKTIKIYLLVALLTAGLPSAWGYSLLGIGESWQVATIGYNLAYTETVLPGGPVWLGDIGGPMNWGEEYRRVTPYMFYAYDQNFLDYFGLAGTTNCDAAFALMNTLTNVSSYSQTLDGLGEFPDYSQAFNPLAQALYLLDLKSVTLHLIVEQLGLAEPERYTWTLHDRDPGNPSHCPTTFTYLIVQRNFNDYDTAPALNQLPYSPIVNNILYTYNVLEFCTGPPPLAVAQTFASDTTRTYQYTAVAANNNDAFGGLQLGGFYTGLTRDDAAGLRYLYNSNNINFEDPSSAGGRLLVTNIQAPTTLTTLPLSLLFQNPMTIDPATLQAGFPGLTFLSVQTNIAALTTTNIVFAYTNLNAPFTNTVSGFPTNVNFPSWQPLQYGSYFVSSTLSLSDFINNVKTNDPDALRSLYSDLLIRSVATNAHAVVVTTNLFTYFTNQTVLPILSNNIPGGLFAPGYFFTNQPGPTIINYPLTQQLFTNIDLNTFVTRAKVTDPATLLGLYPGLVITSYYSVPTNLDTPNVLTYFTNAGTGFPANTPPHLVTVTNGLIRTFFTQFFYTFANVVTNHYYATSPVTVTTTFTTNLVGAPTGNASVGSSSVTFFTNQPYGDLLIIPTNWCGFQVVSAYSPQVRPGISNNVATSVFTNAAIATVFTFSQSVTYLATNLVYNIIPGNCNPKLVGGTNYATNIVAVYNYAFGNVMTNHFYTNSLVRIYTTNVFATPGVGTNLTTNTTFVSYYTNLPAGDIFIVPTNWCGYTYVPLLTNVNATTNLFSAGGGGGAGAGPYYDRLTISYWTNYTFSMRPGFCEAVINSSTNFNTGVVTTYNYVYGGIVTNRYNPNTFVTVITTNLAAVTNGPVGALTNLVSSSLVNIGVTGDFFVIPPQWCGLKILATNLSTAVLATNTVSAANSPSPDVGQQFTQTTISGYTNTTYTVQPQICSTVPPTPNLRRGIERVQFVRANFDSLIGQFFQPITNYYTMTMITNSQQFTEYYQRVITAPDFRFSARDEAAGPASVNNTFNGTVERGINFDQSQVLPNLRGPGTIRGATTFTFNKVGPIFQNGPFPDTNSFFLYTAVNELTQFPLLQWASYGLATNSIVLYPNGISVQNLANSIFIQMQPTTVPDGTNGVAYSQTFTASGGQPPYTWSAPNLSNFPGMNFNTFTQTLSGVPNTAGTFNFIIRLTDSVGRTVDYTFTVTIH
jgi:hypothetical protein